MFDLFCYEWKDDFFFEKVQIWFFMQNKKQKKQKNKTKQIKKNKKMMLLIIKKDSNLMFIMKDYWFVWKIFKSKFMTWRIEFFMIKCRSDFYYVKPWIFNREIQIWFYYVKQWIFYRKIHIWFLLWKTMNFLWKNTELVFDEKDRMNFTKETLDLIFYSENKRNLLCMK